MGVALAGIAYRTDIQSDATAKLVSRLFARNVEQIDAPDVGDFDIRNRGDVMVQFFGDICFIYSNELVWGILADPSIDADSMISAVGKPDFLLAFCQYESGGSFGYAFFEHGTRTRSRLQTIDVPSLPPILEHGAPKDFEVRWFSAPTYFEEDDCPRDEWQKIYTGNDGKLLLPEYSLTQRLLYEALVTNFGICPWETDRSPETLFFRVSPA
ncbi:hypothetical protein [Burkholderia vietnamiensis]|uniref:hypothetical protein n=1 Tax=Burkholderia vietnamiensis TaxID=60552 RepID=UPI000A7AF3A9|nr:hypothetical protein [Burkholderia vietnamiensis]MCA8449252.1 hypothetical protein [Burkholderia vietnamiensis]HDR8953558.1 hypothetical protein [Burkholderia vietnamiensis]HDR9148188.1 hypothetical protein [Burkholderia vietnamiensis]